jgi:hypothetical protein
MVRRVYLVLIFAVGLASLQAQNISDITTDRLLAQHLQIIEKLTDSCLYNPNSFVVGKLYYPRGTKDNHPFFLDNDWKSGFVEIEGKQFPISMMKYDIESDALVILKIIGNQGYPIQLDRNVIPKFSIVHHLFIYKDNAPKAGYYEELCNSNTSVWAKWTIWKKIDANSNSKIPLYISNLHFLIQKNNLYYEVKNLKEIYNIYVERKQNLKKFKRENKLSFRKDKQGTIIKLTEQYDMLNN